MKVLSWGALALSSLVLFGCGGATGQISLSLTGHVVFTSDRTGNSDIFIKNANGSNRLQLTTDAALDKEPALSPDGTKVAFTSNRSGDEQIWVLDLNTSGLTNISNNSADEDDPAWSKDGTRIAFASDIDVADGEIYTMDPDGGNRFRVTTNTRVDTEPTFNPDGTRLAFTAVISGNFEVRLIDSDGTDEAALSGHAAVDEEPDWSISNIIAFTSTRNGDEQIFTVNPDGSSLNMITKGQSPSWSPLSTHFTFMDNTGSSQYDVWVVRADGLGRSKLELNVAEEDDPSWSL